MCLVCTPASFNHPGFSLIVTMKPLHRFVSYTSSLADTTTGWETNEKESVRACDYVKNNNISNNVCGTCAVVVLL